MLRMNEHPSIINFKEKNDLNKEKENKLDGSWLRSICLSAEASDVGFVEIQRKEIEEEKKKFSLSYQELKL